MSRGDYGEAYRIAGVEPESNGDYAEYADYPDPIRNLPESEAFPAEAMPRASQRLIREGAAAIGCPKDFVGVPALVALGAAIGNARVLRLKEGWEEGAAIYGAVIASPGEKKSPGAAVAIEPAAKAQARLKNQYLEKLDEYKGDLRDYEVDRRDAHKNGMAAPPPPEPPQMGRTLVEDTTVEALAVILEENPRGLAVVRDELSAWARAMDQYKSGGRGADRQFYLSAWSNRYASVDRKTKPEPLIIPRPFVGVFGSIQPGILPELGEGREDGLLDRFLFAYPDPLPSRWTDDEISSEARADYATLYGKLRNLHMPEDDQCDPNPVRLHFSPDARASFIDAVNQHRTEMEQPGFPARLKGPWSKLEAYLGRLALVLALSRSVDSGEPERVEVEDVLKAYSLLNYFKAQARRVYVGLYGEDPRDVLAGDLKRFLQERGGRFEGTPTELHQQLKSNHKGGQPEALTRRLNEIQRLSPALGFDERKQNYTKDDGKRSTRNVVTLFLGDL
jgi:putative DNA primase/helicase